MSRVTAMTLMLKVAEMRMKSYRYTHNKSMTTPAVAQMMSTMLYNKRFFPYYISNILGGLDSEGKGCLYRYKFTKAECNVNVIIRLFLPPAMTRWATWRGTCTARAGAPCPCCSRCSTIRSG